MVDKLVELEHLPDTSFEIILGELNLLEIQDLIQTNRALRRRLTTSPLEKVLIQRKKEVLGPMYRRVNMHRGTSYLISFVARRSKSINQLKLIIETPHIPQEMSSFKEAVSKTMDCYMPDDEQSIIFEFDGHNSMRIWFDAYFDNKFNEMYDETVSLAVAFKFIYCVHKIGINFYDAMAHVIDPITGDGPSGYIPEYFLRQSIVS